MEGRRIRGPEPAGAGHAGRQPVSLCCVSLGRFLPFCEWPLLVCLMETVLLTLGCCKGTDGTGNGNSLVNKSLGQLPCRACGEGQWEQRCVGLWRP